MKWTLQLLTPCIINRHLRTALILRSQGTKCTPSSLDSLLAPPLLLHQKSDWWDSSVPHNVVQTPAEVSAEAVPSAPLQHASSRAFLGLCLALQRDEGELKTPDFLQCGAA